MKIIVLRRLGKALFMNEDIESNVDTITLINERGEKLDGTIYYNDRAIKIQGTRTLPSDTWCREWRNLDVSVDKVRYTVGKAAATDNGVLVTQEDPHDILVRLCSNIEILLTAITKHDKRLKALEEAYNGSDITNLT